jgi:hypothetical protein
MKAIKIALQIFAPMGFVGVALIFCLLTVRNGGAERILYLGMELMALGTAAASPKFINYIWEA